MPAGIEKFKGRYLHSRDYKDAQDFSDKRVVVIGIGNSGLDLAVEISQTAKQVSSRTGVLVGRTAPLGHRWLHEDTTTKALAQPPLPPGTDCIWQCQHLAIPDSILYGYPNFHSRALGWGCPCGSSLPLLAKCPPLPASAL